MAVKGRAEDITVRQNQSPDLLQYLQVRRGEGPPHVQPVLLQRCERKTDRIGEDGKRGGQRAVWLTGVSIVVSN